ncbi:molybdopterin-binding oxidoreductase, partial [Actinacidiphila alni]
MRRADRWVRGVLGAVGGLLAAAASLGVAELVSAAARPEASPVTAVGGAVIDRTPASLKDYAVRHFGTNDKLVLQLGIVTILALFALALGVLALWLRRTGCAAVLVFGAIGAVAAWSRPDNHRWDALPSIVGALAGAAVLWVLTGRLLIRRPAGPAEGTRSDAGDTATDPAEEPAVEPTGPESGTRPPGFDRRGFLAAAAATAAASAGTGVLGRGVHNRAAAAAAGARGAGAL